MSNLTSLMQNGNIQTAEPTEYESMTESQMVQILTVAMEDAAVEELTESLLSDENQSILEGVLPDDLVVMEKTIVKLDKRAKKNRAYKLAILQCAKDDDNKEYKQLETIWKMHNFIMRRLEKRYAQKARSRMKQTGKKASGKNGFTKKVKSSLTRSEKETKKALGGNNSVPSKVKSQFSSISSKFGKKA